MIYKKNITEDFDFNNIKNQNIEDEYKFDRKLIVKNIPTNITPIDVLSKKYNINVACCKQCYSEDFGNYQFLNDKRVYLSSNLVTTFHTNLSLRYKLQENGFEKISSDNLPEYLIDFIDNALLEQVRENWKDLPYSSDDIKNIIAYVSPDNGIFIILSIQFMTDDNEFHKVYMGNCTVGFTGELLYNYKNIKSINEDFDFSSIKVKSVESDYTISRILIRDAMSDIPIDIVLLQVFNTTVPSGFICKDKIKGLGTLLSRKNWDKKDSVIFANNIWYVNTKPMSRSLKSKGVFTEYSNLTHDDIIKDDILTEYCDILYDLKNGDNKIDGKLSDLIKKGLVKCTLNKYWLSPDNGIIILGWLDVYDINNKYSICTTGMCMGYTGEITYSIEKLDKGDINKLKTKAEFNNNQWRKAINYILQADGIHVSRSIHTHWLDNTTLNPTPDNKGYIIPIAYNSVTKDMLFRDYNILTYFLRNSYYHPGSYKYIYEKDDNNGNFVSYIYSPNNLWFIYLMSDYNKVVKLIGEKLASQCLSINHKYLMNKVTTQINGCYMFVYITEKGKQILDMLENGDVKIGQLKSKADISYHSAHKNIILDLLK
jgi:hypothetical protein